MAIADRMNLPDLRIGAAANSSGQSSAEIGLTVMLGPIKVG
jgi:hypothetical protein